MTDSFSVLVVDDEPAFREGLRQALKQEGFVVHLAADGEEALEVWRAYHPERFLAVVALEVGADDYVAKPYRVRELVARMRTVLRRSGVRGASGGADGSVLEVGDISLDKERHEVIIGGEPVQMPLKEFQLLALLMENAGIVVTRQTLIDRVWGYDYVGDTKTLDVHIKRLRAKVEPSPDTPERIVTIRGLGYKLSG